MAQWVSHSHGSTLDELIRMEGRGPYIQSICAECSKPQPMNIKVFYFLLPFYHRYLTESIALHQ